MLNGEIENILESMIDKTEYDEPTRSRIGKLLLELKEVIETGGGGTGGVPFTEDDREKLNSLTNPMLLKDRVNTKNDLYDIPNPKPGWVYLVGYEGDNDFAEYIYTDKGRWEFIGYNNIDLSNYVQKTDYADIDKYGIFKLSSSSGLVIRNSDNALGISAASENEVKNETSTYKPLIPPRIPIFMSNYNIDRTTIPEILDRLNNSTMSLGKILEENTDLNEVRTPGVYRANTLGLAQTILNIPMKNVVSFRLEVFHTSGSGSILQKLYPNNRVFGTYYMRWYNEETWGNWFAFEGKEISSTSINLQNEIEEINN